MSNEELVFLLRDGGDAAEITMQLYRQNSGLIETIVRRYAALEDLEDLRQEAYFAIVKAAEMWDPARGNFATCAVLYIRQRVRRYIDNCGGVIRVPTYRQAERPHICSTSEPIGEKGTELQDMIADPADMIGQAVDRIQAEQLRAAVSAEVDALPERQAEVIRRKYYSGQSQRAIAAAIGTGQTSVFKAEHRALQRLKRSEALSTFYYGEAYRRGIKGTGLQAFRRSGTSATERAALKALERSGTDGERKP